MREPRDWDEDYLLNLPVGEFDWLEVKGRRALDLTLSNVDEQEVRQTLSKAVSAMANSGGGVIVLGLRNPRTSWSVDDGGIDLIAKKPSTREWLEDIVPELVDSALTSFNVYVVQSRPANSQIAAGRGIFIIEIPDSEQAPHQATDNKYYARVAGKSRPIGHRLVADIFGRRQNPKIVLEFQIRSGTYTEHGPLGLAFGPNLEKKCKFELVLAARNVGRVYAKYVNSSVYLPVVIVPEFLQKSVVMKGVDFRERNGVKYLVWHRRNTQRDFIKSEGVGPSEYGSSWFDPILPGLSYTWDWRLTDKFDKATHGDLRILWEVSADNAPEQEGSVLIRDIDLIQAEQRPD